MTCTFGNTPSTMLIGTHVYVAKSGVGITSIIASEDYMAQPRVRAVSLSTTAERSAGKVRASRSPVSIVTPSQ